MAKTSLPTSRVENSAQVLSCQLKLVPFIMASCPHKRLCEGQGQINRPQNALPNRLRKWSFTYGPNVIKLFIAVIF
jgi:hypothetical protein